MNTSQSRSTPKRFAPAWPIVSALLLLSAVPVAAGTARMIQLIGGSVTPDSARFFASPLPVVLHVASVTLYALLGAFQFPGRLRRRWPRWHRMAGRVLVPAGLVAALSGLWMTQFYPWPAGDGIMLYWLRLVFGSAMLLSIVCGAIAIRQRRYTQHGAWMIRAYAIGMGAGTQVLTHLPLLLVPALYTELGRGLAMGAGWTINLAVAEWIIHRQQTHRQQHAPSEQIAPTRTPDLQHGS